MKLKYGVYSYSKISLFEQCPYRFYIQYILKPNIPSPPSFYLEKGNFVHSLIESILDGSISTFKVPTFELLKKKDKKAIYKTIINFCSHEKFKEIKKSENKLIEHRFFLDENLIPCTKENGVIKGKIDLLYEESKQLWIYDWKTSGQTLEKIKRYPRKSDQLELYALWGLQKYKMNESLCSFAYVDVNYYDQRIFTIDDLPELKEKWKQKIEIIEEAEEFPRSKSRLCDYCENQEFCEKMERKERSLDRLLEFDFLDEQPF